MAKAKRIETAWLQKPPLGVQMNRAHPLAQGLVGCWLFNEGGGDKAYDLSGYGNHGTLNDMAFPPTVASGWNPGKDGVMLNFDGSTDYVSGSLTLEAGNPFSSIWMTYPKTHINFNQIVDLPHICHTTTVGSLYCGVDSSTRFTPTHLPAGTMTLNQWQQFAFIHTGDTGYFYKNALLLAGPKNMTAPPGKSTFEIGANGVGTINGSINYAFVYTRALSAQEIQQLYMYPYAMFEPVSTYALANPIPIFTEYYNRLRV